MQNLVILPSCLKAEKRTPPFPTSSRATLQQRPPGTHWRHKTLAQNMVRAILRDRNSQENLVNFFVVKVRILYLTGEVLEMCFLELSLCTFGANAVALIVSAGKWFILSPLLVTHSIRYALCSSTLLYESRKRNCLPCLPFCMLQASLPVQKDLTNPKGLQSIKINY